MKGCDKPSQSCFASHGTDCGETYREIRNLIAGNGDRSERAGVAKKTCEFSPAVGYTRREAGLIQQVESWKVCFRVGSEAD